MEIYDFEHTKMFAQRLEIDSLFQLIKHTLESRPEQFEVHYHETYFFPQRFEVNQHLVIVDGGYSFQISHFEEID